MKKYLEKIDNLLKIANEGIKNYEIGKNKDINSLFFYQGIQHACLIIKGEKS